jgi:hypothetical protein
MPKDYQKVEDKYLDLLAAWGETPLDKEEVLNILSTYGNTRELEAVEKVEKGVPAPLDKSYYAAEVQHTCRQATLDHIERVKKELT